MRLSRIRLVNYRRFRDATLDLPEGLTAIVGRNGAGKSSLLEAILWTLYGHEAARTGKELLKRDAAAPGEDLVVRLDFELEGVPYAVTRRLKGKGQQPEAAVEGAGQLLVAPGPHSWDQANQYLERLLGFDRLAFESTVVAKQGELAALSDMRPAERKRLLLGMLGIERIDTALQHVRTEARLLDARLAEVRRTLEAEPRARADLERTSQEHAAASQGLAVLSGKLVDGKTAWTAARDGAERLRADRERDQVARLRLGGLQARLEAVWGQRTRVAAESNLLRDREPEAQRLRQALAALDDVDGALAASQESARRHDRLRGVEKRRAAIATELARWRPATDPHAVNGSSPATLEERMQRARAALEEDTRRGARLAAELEAAALELQSAAPEAGHAVDPEAPCPTCGRPFGATAHEAARRREAEARDRRAALEVQRTRLSQELALSQEDRRKWADEAATAQRLLDEVRLRIQRAQLATQEMGRLEAEDAALADEAAALGDVAWDDAAHARLLDRRRERDAHRQALARCEEQLARLPRLRDEDRVLQAQEQTLVAEREATSRELRSVGYEPGSWERAHEAAEALREDMERGERERARLAERAAAYERDIARLRALLADLGERRKEAEASAAHLRVLDVLAGRRADQGLLAEFRNHLIGRIRPALARHASTLVRQMTQGRYQEIVLDEDYGAALVDAGVAHPLERFSGGEVDVANLALRLAVSELVTNARGRNRLQVVALDEVFGSQDDGRRGAVLESLHALSNVFRQVLVVTHLDDVRERVQHVVRVDEDDERHPVFSATWQGKA